MAQLYGLIAKLQLSIGEQKSMTTATLHKAILVIPVPRAHRQWDSFTSAANEAAHWAFVIKGGMS